MKVLEKLKKVKVWNSETAFGVDMLIQTLNWIENNKRNPVIVQVIFVQKDTETGELYRIVYYEHL